MAGSVKEGVVTPIIKRGEGDRVKDYKGVTPMPILYKVYASMLAETEMGGRRKRNIGREPNRF